MLAVLHAPAYREANAGALRMGWPRIPLPGGAAFARTADRVRELAALLNPDSPAPGVTTSPLRPELAAIAVPATADGRNMTGADFALTAGWGHYGTAGAVMPGQGRVTQRPATSAQPAALGAGACDVHLNDRARWSNVPAAVWDYRLGGYQVLKKWLSYRERAILGRIGQAVYFVQHDPPRRTPDSQTIDFCRHSASIAEIENALCTICNLL